MPSRRDAVAGLTALIRRLRSEDGCPWDRAQTARTMVAYLIEEAYELADAVLADRPDQVCEELGDVLFQLLFVAWLYQEKGAFTLDDAIEGVHEKMVRRHPHVFGEECAADSAAVRRRWEEIKRTEKGAARSASLLDGVPAGLPALMRADQVSQKAAGAGFDWSDLAGVMAKAEEEWAEFNREVAAGGPPDENGRRLAMEFGDILFTLVNVARFARIHPETALVESIAKFEKRFRHMEMVLGQRGRTVASSSREELDRMWEAAKAEVDSEAEG